MGPPNNMNSGPARPMPGPAGAGEKATPREAYAKVTAAANYLSKAGEDGIGSLGDPKKGFIWKDSSVWVARCESNSCLPNPRAKANRVLISETKCYKTGKLYILDLCDRVVLMDHGRIRWEGPPDQAADVVVDQLFDPAGAD